MFLMFSLIVSGPSGGICVSLTSTNSFLSFMTYSCFMFFFGFFNLVVFSTGFGSSFHNGFSLVGSGASCFPLVFDF